MIETIALVVPEDYRGPIIIFYDQPHQKGEIEIKNGKHFIYIPKDGIVFTKYKLGEGFIEIYSENLQRMDEYGNTLNPQKLNNEDYDIIGGAYNGFKSDKNKFISYSLFRAGSGSQIKNDSIYVYTDTIKEIYKNEIEKLK